MDDFLTKKIKEIRPRIEKQLEQDTSIRLRMVTGDFRIEEMHENENREEVAKRHKEAMYQLKNEFL